jgi:hypothetical protein
VKPDFKKTISDLLGKLDNKMLEAKMQQAIEMIKKGDHDEIIKKINTIDKDELSAKLNEFASMKPEEFEAFREKLGIQVKKEDITPISDKLGSDGKRILEKIISTFKIT